IACRNNPFTADRYRPAAKPTLQRLLDRREKAVHVHANDMRGGKAPHAYRLGFCWPRSPAGGVAGKRRRCAFDTGFHRRAHSASSAHICLTGGRRLVRAKKAMEAAAPVFRFPSRGTV